MTKQDPTDAGTDDTDNRSAAAEPARLVEMREANAHLVLASLAADESREQAERERKRQEDFLATLAHELRNPLAPLRSAADILVHLPPGDPSIGIVAEVIDRQVRHLTRLVDDLLDAARLTQGKIRLQREVTSVDDFVNHAVEASQAVFQARNQRVALELPSPPQYVNGDPVRLAQIVGNLLHNASKYSPAGSTIHLCADVVGTQLQLRVRDAGVGIANDILPSIFELFTQGDQSARAIGAGQGTGLGIGLTVVQRLVTAHGGSVEARSDGVGKGSEFLVNLPLVAGPPARPAVASQPVAAARTQHVLVIDDNVDAGQMLALCLEAAGHRADVATSGEEGLQRFADDRPDVVICDIAMPGIDGYEVATRLREIGGSPAVVMIALTGFGTDKDKTRAELAGFDQHVAKPVDTVKLLKLIGANLLK
ncbi:hypothetical protein BH11PSE14_BH11PSE14_14280 [soil metagenome]